MNKYLLFGIMLFLLLLITYIVDVTQVYTISGGLENELIGAESIDEVSVSSMVQTFFGLMFFRIEGFPAILNILIFYPIAGIFLFMGIDIAKDIIPFT